MKEYKPFLPFLFDATFKWFVQNDINPMLLIDPEHPDARVPEKYISTELVEGIEIKKIVLQINPVAIKDYSQNEKDISFSAKFDGVDFFCVIPYNTILAMFERNGVLRPLAMSDPEAINQRKLIYQEKEKNKNKDDNDDNHDSSALKLV